MTDLLPDIKAIRRRAWGMAEDRPDLRPALRIGGGEVDAEFVPGRHAPHFGPRLLARSAETALKPVPALDRSGAHPIILSRNEPHLERGRLRDADALRWQRLPRAAWQRLGPRRLAALIVLSVLVNLALLTLALFGGGGGGLPYDEEQPIPIQLVLNHPPEQAAPPKPPPPPPPKAADKSKQTPPPPPPPGRLASDEMGDVDATGKAPVPDPGPAAGKPQPKAGEAPPPPAEAPPSPNPSEVAVPKPAPDPTKSTAPKQAELPPTPEQLAAAGDLAPPPPPPKPEPPADTPVVKPVPKPAQLKLVPQPGGARKPTPEPEAEDHGEGHKATMPGPDASRDEYLAYLKALVLEHRDMLSAAVTGGRHGELDLDIRINARGSILQIFVRHSSGYPDLDKRAIDMTYAAGQLPPVPERLLERGYLGALFHMPVPLPQ
jgi:TonB family protein